MGELVKAVLHGGPLDGKWRNLLTGEDALPPREIRVTGLLGVSLDEGGRQRTVVYRRADGRHTAERWVYEYDRDE
ncbi:hypothetical protein [Streptomyces canus]|uniref:hypothetical protein n=1 Tax=Streptomyces canus TaxID=58343 RepID=UPI000748457A|nr:hypothetical protein [Streptomyces canus]KUN07595.1 hypothetical protein AQI96_29385 [Streptomyces canus]